jgi:hypothetical protein
MFYKFCLIDNEQNLFQLTFQDKMAEKRIIQKKYNDKIAGLIIFLM